MSYDFKKEEDVKEYIKNLGIEYRFGCFSEKDPQSMFSNLVIITIVHIIFIKNNRIIIFLMNSSLSVTR